MTQDEFLERCIPEPNSGCWLWLGYVCDRHGYPYVGIARKKLRANRVAWQLFRGTIPIGLFVCHKCDNRSCVNPDHMFLGTHLANMADMHQKGRAKKNPIFGEANGAAKLTEDAIRSIRLDTRSLRAIARDFGVAHSLIRKIRNRKLWVHVS